METLTQLLYAHMWQGLLLVPLTFLLTKIFAKQDSTLRHRLWTITLCLLFIMPAMTFVELPRYSTDWQFFNKPQDTAPVAQDDFINIEEMIAVSQSQIDEAAPVTSEVSVSWSTPTIISTLLLLLWAGGTALKSRAILNDIKHCRKLRSLDDLTEILVESLPAKWPMGTKIMTTDAIKTPMMVGFFNPIVLMPNNFMNMLPKHQLNSILFHELAHIERHDQWNALLQQIIIAILWWSPWAWFASNSMRKERELSCDDIAVARTGNAKDYAKALIDGSARIVKAHSKTGSPALAPGVFHRPSELKERIMRLTKKDYLPNNKLKRPLSVATMSVLALGIAGISFATPGAAIDMGQENGELGIAGIVYDATVNYDPIQEAFVEAGARSNPDNLARLINAGADINGIQWGDGTALMLAIRAENMPNVRYLLENGANPNIGVRGDGNAMIDAVRAERMDILEMLVKNGADINQSVRGDGNALIVASSRGYTEMVDYILRLGADVDMIVFGDDSALISAARQGKFESVKLLIEAGANPNLGSIERNRCRTPLGVSANNPEIRDYLVANGATTTKCS